MSDKQQVSQVRLGGLGGQGVITACRILGDALAMDGWNVLQTQSYGIEARGGASCGEVLYGGGEINSLRVSASDILLALSESALDAYIGAAKPGSWVFFDSYMIKRDVSLPGHKVYSAPFTEIALTEMGGDIYTNLIALGFICGITRAVSVESLEAALAEQIKGNAEKNLDALRRGFREATEAMLEF